MRYAFALLIAAGLCSQATGAKPVQRLMIVEKTQQKAANEACVKLFGPHAANTFSVEMDGPGAKVFLVCSWRLTDEQMAKLKAELDKLSGTKPQVMSYTKENPTADEFTDARAKLRELNISRPSQKE